MVQAGDFVLFREDQTSGRWIGALELLSELAAGRWRRADRDSLYRHAAIVTAVDGAVLDVIEARPSRAGANTYRASANSSCLFSTLAVLPAQRDLIVAWARQHVGAGYAWQAYPAQAAWKLGVPGADAWCASVSHSGRYICSQFVVTAYRAAGIDLFPDRPACAVAPSDLASLCGR